MLSDRLRTIAARLCKTADTQIDGRMLLADAEEAARLESELAEIHEAAGDVLMTLNDQTEALRGLAERLSRRPVRAVDGGRDISATIVRATEDCCSCGGLPAEDPNACPACQVYHRLFSKPNAGARPPQVG